MMYMLLSIGIAQANGGEGNNTGCQGQGNPNSPCEGNDNGNNGNNGNNGDNGGGNSGTPPGDNIGINNQTSNNTSVQDTTVSTNNEQSTIVNYTSNGSDLSKRVPNHYAPSTNNSYNAYSCLKGASGGISVSGFGGSLGGYTLDKNCDIRVNSSILMDYGLDDHAIQVLCQLDDMREADKRVAEMRGTEPRCFGSKKEENKSANNVFNFYDDE